MNNFPNIIGRDLKINNRIHDNWVTPTELIYKNFDDNEVDLIKSDPQYFKPKRYEEQLDSVNILKKRKLLDVLNEEESKKERKKVKFYSTISMYILF